MILLSKRGFSLVEVLAVLIIIAIMASVATLKLDRILPRAQELSLIATLKTLQNATNRFYLSSNRYPTVTDCDEDWFGVIVDWQAQDPKGNTFVGSYIHSRPSHDPLQYGLNPQDGEEVFFGITQTGLVFATQERPMTP
jgi:prepilin-type N-terminal cleavage/methylation domain-containing protein